MSVTISKLPDRWHIFKAVMTTRRNCLWGHGVPPWWSNWNTRIGLSSYIVIAQIRYCICFRNAITIYNLWTNMCILQKSRQMPGLTMHHVSRFWPRIFGPHSARQGYHISYFKGSEAISVPPSFLYSDIWIIPKYVYNFVAYNHI